MVAEVYKPLEAYALANYNAGGDWVVECFDDADYAEYLDAAGGDVEVARLALRKYWELVYAQERDCAFGDGEY